MASVTLSSLWVQRVNDLSDGVEIGYYEHVRPTERDGGVRTYAGGRRRSIVSAGTARRWEVACRIVPKSDVDWLEDRLDAHDRLLVRDVRGKRLYVVLLKLSPDEWIAGDRASFTAVFEQVDYDESV